MDDLWAEDYLRDRARIATAEDILRISAPPALFSNLLPERTLCLLSAEPHCGKTMLSLAMAVSLSSGSPFLGSAPREKRRTLFIGQDAPTWDVAAQLRKLCIGYAVPASQLEIDFILNHGVDLLDARGPALLRDWHDVHPFHFLVLDTLASLHGSDENNTRDMIYLMAVLKSLRDSLGITILFTAHTRKPQQGEQTSANYRVRGSTVIAGSIDFHLQLTRISDSPHKIGLRFPKGRGSLSGTQPINFIITEAGGGVRLEIMK